MTNARSRARRRLTAAASAALLVGALLAACGGNNSTASSGGMDKVRVGVIPIIDVAAIYVGKQQGFFTQQHIDLDLQPASGGAAIVPTVLSGQTQFGFSSIVSILTGAAKGLPLKAVTPGLASTGVQGKDMFGLVAQKNSGIKTAKDFAGKTVATNALDNICTVTVQKSMADAGGDPKSVKFTEVAPADTVAALEKGSVQAACLTEPFLTPYLQSQGELVTSGYVNLVKDAMISVYFTSEKLIQSNPDLVKRFTTAMDESLQYADTHPDAVRAVIPTYTTIPAAQVKDAVLPRFPSTFSPSVVNTMVQITKEAEQYGVVPQGFDVHSILPDSAGSASSTSSQSAQ